MRPEALKYVVDLLITDRENLLTIERLTKYFGRNHQHLLHFRFELAQPQSLDPSSLILKTHIKSLIIAKHTNTLFPMIYPYLNISAHGQVNDPLGEVGTCITR